MWVGVDIIFCGPTQVEKKDFVTDVPLPKGIILQERRYIGTRDHTGDFS